MRAQIMWVYVGPRVGAHICLNLGVGLDRILHHTAKYLRVVARLPLAIYIYLLGGAFLTCNTACSYAPAHAFARWLELWVCNPGVARSSLTFSILTVKFSTGTRSFCVQ